MLPNPLLGVVFHWLGGLSSASFYVPYKRIKGWSWEIFWLSGGIFSWAIAPWLFASIQTNNLVEVLASVPKSTILWCYFWGSMWGLGGLTFGLTMRYLGLSLGMAVALGLTTVIGTLGEPIFTGKIIELVAAPSGRFVIIGILMVLAGIYWVSLAGHAKNKELATNIINDNEFDLKKGLLIACFSGIMSGCFSFGLAAGQPIRDASLKAGTDVLWQGLPVLCIVLAGGLTSNLIWCLHLIIKNKSAGQLLGNVQIQDGDKPNLVHNYALAALGGTLWYFQFFFYTMGESQMGEYKFSSWTLHMASIILFSTLWGFALKEWYGVTKKTRNLVWLGIGSLVLSTFVIGIGNMLES